MEKIEKKSATKLLEIISVEPELVPLTEEQKEAFLTLWNICNTYERKRDMVSQISDIYHNRDRYKALLSEEDRKVFYEIQKDDDTKAF